MPVTNVDTNDQQNPEVGQQVAMSNADDSRNGVSPANQAPAYGDPGQPAAPPVPTPAQQHTGWFHGMMARMNQGDQQVVRDKNGNPVIDTATGRPQTQPLSSKQMGRSILAGVLSAMAATEQHQPYRNGNGIWVDPSNERNAAAQQAFQAHGARQQFQQADKQLQAQRTQQYATYKNNVDMFKMAHEISAMKFDDRVKATAGFAPAYESAMRGEIEGTNPETLDLSPDDAKAAMSDGRFNSTSQIMVPNGKVTQHLDAKGLPIGGSDVHWMILPGQNGKITMTDSMIKAAGLEGKGLVGGKTQIPLTQWSDLTRNAASQHIVTSLVDHVTEQLNIKDKAGNPVKLDYPTFIKAARLTPNQLQELKGLDREDPVEFQKGLKKLNAETGGQVETALGDQGITIDTRKYLADQKAQEKKEAEEEQAKIAEQKAEIERIARMKDPVGQADLQNKQLEIKLKQQQLNQQAAAAQGVDVPKGFVPNPDAASLSENDLTAALHKQGVNIPDNFAALYAIGHNDADLKTYSASPRKGVPVMPQATALAFIRQYINPQYQEGDYSAGLTLKKEIASTRVGTAGGSLLNAGVASNHIDLLAQAALALNNGDVQLMNKWANMLGVEVGKTPAVTFQAIADQVNGEVGKVVYGGTPREAELSDLRKRLNSDQSPQQVKSVARAYVGLMAGRVNEINERSQQYFGKDVKGISPTVTQVFNKYGFAVGSQVTVIGKNGQPHIFPSQKAADGYKKAAGIQ